MYSPFLGMVQYFAFDWAPKGYALCNGAQMSIQQNAALFSLLGTYYGGNGTTTFALPDLRGRTVRAIGPSFSIGEVTGTATATMLTVNMPIHTHSATPQIAVSNADGATNVPTNGVPAVSKANRGAAQLYTNTAGSNEFLGAPGVTVGMTGSAAPINIMNPYLAVTACIALQGIFPSRN